MRRILASLAAAAIATSVTAASTAAAPAQRYADTQFVLLCEGLVNDAGTAFAVVAESDQFGPYADLAFWAAPGSREFDPPTWIASSAIGSFDGGSVTATFELVTFEPPENPEEPPLGDPVGEATLAATLTPDGPPEAYEFRGSEATNRQFRQSGTLQAFTVAGTLNLPEGISFDLSGCTAFLDSFQTFSNAPAATVSHFSDFQLGCTWIIGDEAVFLFASANQEFAFADLFISGPSGEIFGSTMGALTDTSFEASWTLYAFDGAGPGDPVGTATASASLAPTGERLNDRFGFGNFKAHVTGEIYAVAGMVHIETDTATYDLPMDATSCFAGDVRVMQHESARQGPRGRPLANDAPDGALPLAVGESVTVNTSGTAAEAEAPCLLTVGDEVFEVPIAHTAWWTVEGTGGPVTIDTAGTEFDTVLGVYVEEDDGSFVQVGCVDDTEAGLQAVITVDTVEGVTYHVQAGGFLDQSGILVLSAS